MFSARLLRKTSVLVAAALTLPATVVLVTATPAAAAGPAITVSKTAPAQVLVGTPITYSVTATNPAQVGAVPEYNLSVRDVLPTGVTYVAGSTTPSDAGEPRSLTVAGRTVLIWDNIADLQVAGSYKISFQAIPNAATLPPGSSVSNVADGYTNTNPRNVATFSATGVPVAGSYTQTSSSPGAGTVIVPLVVEKDEPSSEGELMRGVHDNTTVYTLTTRNSGQAPTTGATLTDYIPAGMEFLGCGGVDNSSGPEYPGAPSLTATPVIPVAQCPTPTSVDTVLNPAGLPAGVYTVVVWTLGTLAVGEVRTIKYAAGIPLRANTMTFTGGTPTPGSLTQTANLNNNSGASTRETTTEQALTNRAVAAGTYTGPMATGANPSVSSSVDLTRTAEDLAVAKSVSPTSFTGGNIATYQLVLRGSEYVTSAGVVATDTIPNGLCPLSTTTNYAIGAPTECNPGAFAPTATVSSPGNPTTSTPVSYAGVVANADGTFVVTFSPLAVPKDGTVVVTYKARMRTTYVQGNPTASGDDYTNNVSVTGTTTPIANTGESGPQTVNDVSSATITSDSPSIDKTTMASNITPYTCDQGPYSQAASLPVAQVMFHKGDRACFQLQVNFSGSNYTRNAAVTDFLPTGASYEALSATLAPGNTLPAAQVVFNEAQAASAADNPTWTLGLAQGGANYVAPGTVFVVRMAVIFNQTPAVTTPAITGNLMKLRAENTAGTAFSLRDREDVQVAPAPPVTIQKGVYQVNSLPAAGNAPNIDGVQVKEGDAVRFRVDLTNPGTVANGNNQTVFAPDVWDVLPTGITCAQISNITDGGLCTNPLDPTQPTFTTRATNSAIRWKLPTSTTLPTGGRLTVFYDMAIPAPTSVSAVLTNTASVASFQAHTNRPGQDVTFFPKTNVDTTVPAANQDAPVATNASNVFLGNVVVTKTQVTSINESNNDLLVQAVIGETVTYTLTATVPAGSTVYRGSLTDTLPAGLTFVAGSASAGFSPAGTLPATNPLPSGVTQDPATGALTFPTAYDNTTATAQLFRVTFTALVTTDPTNLNAVNRVNTASFVSFPAAVGGAALPARTATSTTTVVEPAPTLTKVSNPVSSVVAGQTVNYTLTAGNTAGRPPLHDSVVVDCLPAGIIFTAYGTTTPPGITTQPASAGNVTNGCAATTTRLAWNVGDILGGATAVLPYTATVSTLSAGAASYTNTATITGSSLNDGANLCTVGTTERCYTATAANTVSLAPAGITKAVDSPTHTIGDTVTYTVVATLPATVNFYDASVIDVLPAGIDPTTLATTSVTCSVPIGSCAVAGTPLTPDLPNRKVGWLLGDLLTDPQVRTVTIVYTAKIVDVPGNSRGVVLSNSASVKWNLTNGPDPTSAGATFDTTSGNATTNVTVVEPHVVLAKTVDDTTPEPGQTFTYSVTASNSGAANLSTAYNITVVDTVPTGVVVNAASISDGGVLAGAGPNGGGTITWTLPSLNINASKTFTYSAKLAASATLTAAALTNSADATYASRPTGGRSYDDVTPATAVVTPTFPKITPTKSAVTGSPAYIGSPFTWQLRLTNTGGGKAYGVDGVDTVPLNWRYTSGATVSVDGGPATVVEPVITFDGAGRQVLTWTDLGDLATGRAIVITLITVPQNAPPISVLLAPGVGASVAQTNTVSATASDATGATGNASGPYNNPPGTASTHIDSADVKIVKSVSTPFVAGATGAWTLQVSNLGPDTAVAPFTVTDTLPVGVTFVSAIGTGWACSFDLPTRVITCSQATGTLASGASAAAIVVRAAVDSATGPGTTYTNTATVAARTYDPAPANNTSTVTATVTASADLAIVKALSGSLIAGQSATYTLSVNNIGPSVAAAPVTVTDTLPASLTYVSASGAGWTCTMAVVAGAQQITCTMAALPVGPAPVITVTATVRSSQTAAIANTATVTSPTPDPVPGNNTSTDTHTPGTSADIALQKSHVGTFLAGTSGQYKFVVDNNGPSDAAGPLTLTDTLPTGVVGGPISGPADGWVCSYAVGNPQQLTCTRAAGLAAGGESTVAIGVQIASTVTGSLTNTAVVGSPTPDPIPGNNTSTDVSNVTTSADLALTKTPASATVVAGQTASYTLSARNIGPSSAQAPVTVTDVVPVGMTFGPTSTAGGTGWSCSYVSATRSIVCTGGAVGAGVTASDINVVLDVDSGVVPSSIRNDAVVGSPTPDPDPSNNNAFAVVTVTADATLSIVKSRIGTAPVPAGATTQFTLAVHNAGPSDAQSVTVVDTAPPGLTPTAASGTGWTCAVTAPTITCTTATVVAGQDAPMITVTATVGASVPSGTTLVNSATVSTTTSPQTDTDTANVPVVASADLSLAKSHRGTVVVAGQVATYDLVVHNGGPSDAQAPITIVDQLPVGLTFVAVTGAGWTCVPAAAGPSGQQVTCTVVGSAALAAGGDAATLTMQVLVAPGAAAATYRNTATVSSPTPDPVPGNNTATNDLTVGVSADLSIVKSHTGPVHVGDLLAFSLLVTNAGPSDATGVVVADDLPAGLTFDSASGPAGWTCSSVGAAVTCGTPLLAAGTDATITLTVRVTAAAYPTVTNIATVAAATPDPDPGNNTSADPVLVPALVDLAVTKVHQGAFAVGSSGTYLLHVSNAGPTAAPGPVTVSDTLPTGLTYSGGSGAGWTCTAAGQNVTCVLAAGLAAGASSDLTLAVAIGPAAYPDVSNTAAVTSPAEDTDPGNNTGTDTAPVTPQISLRLLKTLVSYDAATATATWNVAVNNFGPNNLVSGLVVVDTLPSTLRFTGSSGTGWTCAAVSQTVTCSYARALAVGASTSFALTTAVTATPGTTVSNSATITAGPVNDTNPGDNHASAVLDVPTGPPGPNPPLPHTGGDVLAWLLIGLMSLAIGTALRFGGVRPRRGPG